jgi:hypothetical protein
VTPVEAKTTIETAFKAGWGPTPPIAWGNTTPPMPDSAPWVRFTIIHAPARLRSWTGNVYAYERPGIVFVQVFVPLGTGTRTGTELAHRAVILLEGKKFGALEMGTASIAEVGQSDTAMDQTQVRIEFVYDELRTMV